MHAVTGKRRLMSYNYFLFTQNPKGFQRIKKRTLLAGVAINNCCQLNILACLLTERKIKTRELKHSFHIQIGCNIQVILV